MKQTRDRKFPAAHRIILVAALGMAGTLAAAEPSANKKDPSPFQQQTGEIRKRIDDQFQHLESLYKHLHENPELSLQEEKTSARLVEELKAAGFQVTEKVGGYGVVGVLKNGPGPTVLVRTDMDALPVVEQTGLAYASKVRARDRAGNDVGVMHACGHDMHMTCWIGTATVLAGMKDRWRGTLVFIGQPAEEVGIGTRAMLDAGLFQDFPRPDYCLALHCDARTEIGHITYTEGLALANVDTVEIVVHGKGGHGAALIPPSIRSCWRPGSSWTCKPSSAARSTPRTRP